MGKKLNEWLEKDLEDIVGLCNKANIKLIIQNYPYPYAVANRILESVALRHSVSFIDNYMFVDKLARQHGLRIYILDGNHCTLKGHHMIAKNVYDTLVRKVLF